VAKNGAVRNRARSLVAAAFLTVLCGGAPAAVAESVQLEYLLTLPEPFDPKQEYPALLALPPGPQDEAMVEIADRAYWSHGRIRGWIVVSPIAPGGKLFFDGSERLIPSLLGELLENYPIEAGRFHVGGISNGGIAAFRVSENNPELFCSLLVLPGLPGNENDFTRLDRIRHLPVDMMVGEHDERWVARMRETEARLRELEAQVSLRVLPGVGHMISRSVSASFLFDRLEAKREGCRDAAAGERLREENHE
jgi:predicted esterase